jgi:hypothetical protein
MTRSYPKDPPVEETPPAEAKATDRPPREKSVSELHEEEIEQARTEIAALVEKAREVEYDREDPNAGKPEHEFLAELQDIFKQVHKLNARWLAGPGYEYAPPPFVPAVPPPTEPAASTEPELL